jgi:hypothetical protein
VDLLQRLLDGIRRFRQVDFTYDVETVVGHSLRIFLKMKPRYWMKYNH